jgi:hypothetical protein
MLWSFVTAITITTKPYRNHDFTFVSNRLSSSLSNILFLLAASFIGSITATLSGNLVKLLVSILFKQGLFHFYNGSLEFVLGLGVSIIYVFFLSSIGYLIGTLVQVSKGFIILIPVLLLGSIFLAASMHKEPLLIQIFQFYMLESSLLLFILKTLLTTVLFFIAAISLLNRMEVKR